MSSAASALITLFWCSVAAATVTVARSSVVTRKIKISFIEELSANKPFRILKHIRDTRKDNDLLCCAVWFCERSCAFALHRSGGFLSKILKKRPHKEAQTPDNGELTLAQVLSERPAGGEGKEDAGTRV